MTEYEYKHTWPTLGKAGLLNDARHSGQTTSILYKTLHILALLSHNHTLIG